MGALRGIGLVVIATVVHLIFCYSVIDIHFQSPVISGVPPVWPDTKPHSKRIVLIVADGLRPDYLFRNNSNGEPLAPFLRYLATCVGRYGVSHTRPPTESRPGHVALTAGFYEDPSALFSGWQSNPVPFDSIFRHVAGAWGLGSPDVVPIWDGHGNYTWRAYDASMEDWGVNTDLTSLDTWVFNETNDLMEELFKSSRIPLHHGPAILFQHLLGLDSQSHAHGGPHAQQYLDNIQIVDEGVAKTVQLFESRFPDGSTTYIFTADHGTAGSQWDTDRRMTDHASHGDASPECTRTPFVAWGPGISRSAGIPKSCAHSPMTRKMSLVSHVIRHALIQLDVHDVLGWRAGRLPWACGPCMDVPWATDAPERLDIHQAQIAPLMAALLGVPVPTNCMFMLPLELIDAEAERGVAPQEFQAQALWANVRSLLSAYDARAKTVRASTLLFRHHPGLQAQRKAATEEIEELLQRKQFAQALPLVSELGRHAEASLLYLQRYHWLLLYSVVVAQYVLWMLWVMLELLQDGGGDAGADTTGAWAEVARKAKVAVYSVMAVVLAVLAHLKVPATFWVYFLCLGLLAVQTARALPTLLQAASSAMVNQRTTTLQLVVIAALAVTVAQGFLYRPIHFVVAIWLAVGTVYAFCRTPSLLLSASAAGLLVCTAAFALLPLRKEPNTALVILPGIAAACAVMIARVSAFIRSVSTWAAGGVRSHAATGAAPGQRGGWWALLVQSVLAIVASVCIVALQRIVQEKPECADGEAWQRHLCSATVELNLMLTDALEPVTRWAWEAEWLQVGGMSAPQLLLWCCFCLAPAVPLLTARSTLPRLLSSLFGFHIMFMILAISWESVFFACFACMLVVYSLLLTTPQHGRAEGGHGQAADVARGGDLGMPALVHGAVDDVGVPPPQTPPARRTSRRASVRQAAQSSRGAAESAQGENDVARRRGRSASSRRGSRRASKSPLPRKSPAVRRAGGGDSGSGDHALAAAVWPSDSLRSDSGAVRPDAGLSMAEVWYAFALVFSTNLGFFGMGNMASVASFEPASVLRLMTCAPVVLCCDFKSTLPHGWIPGSGFWLPRCS